MLDNYSDEISDHFEEEYLDDNLDESNTEVKQDFWNAPKQAAKPAAQKKTEPFNSKNQTSSGIKAADTKPVVKPLPQLNTHLIKDDEEDDDDDDDNYDEDFDEDEEEIFKKTAVEFSKKLNEMKEENDKRNQIVQKLDEKKPANKGFVLAKDSDEEDDYEDNFDNEFSREPSERAPISKQPT